MLSLSKQTGQSSLQLREWILTLIANKEESWPSQITQQAKANIAWDEEAIQQIAEQWEIAPESWGIKPNEGENDPVSEWVGMPEYEGEDQSGVKDLIIHFKTMEGLSKLRKAGRTKPVRKNEVNMVS